MIILITGASSGLGAELARQLAAPNTKLFLIARRQDRLLELKKELQQFLPLTKGEVSRSDGGGYTIELFPCDVTDQKQVQSAIKTCKQKLGLPDKIILNAGKASEIPEDKFDLEKIRSVMETNLWGSLYFIEALLPDLIKRKSGHIIGISSLAAFIASPGSGAYSASKSALFLFLESLRRQLKKHNIQVTTICPGFIKSELTAKNQFSMPFLMETQDGVKKIIKAINKKKSVYYFPWQLHFLIKLTKILPIPLVDKIITKKGYKKSQIPLQNWK